MEGSAGMARKISEKITRKEMIDHYWNNRLVDVPLRQ